MEKHWTLAKKAAALSASVLAAASLCAENFDFSDFGAVGDGTADNSQALAKAIAALEKTPGATLTVPKGVYSLNSMGVKYIHETFHARFANLKNVSIKGDGAEFVFTNPGHGGFLFYKCENLALEGIALDWNPLPFTQGEIVSVDKDDPRSFIFKPELGFPPPDNPNFIISTKGGARVIGFVFDSKTRRLFSAKLRDNHKEIAEIKRLENGLFKISIAPASKPDAVSAGNLFAFVQRTLTDGLVLHNCDAPAVKNTTLYSSSHLGIVFRGCRRPLLDGAQLVPKPGSNRMISTNADGIWLESCYDGPRVENCELDSVMDDGIVLSIYGRLVQRKIDAQTYQIKRTWATDLRVGDIAEAVDLDGRRTGPLPKIISVEANADNSENVKFDGPVPELSPKSRIFNLSMADDNTILRNNKIRNLRGNGFKIHGASCLVEKNMIDGTTFTGIEAGFQNGGGWWVWMWSDKVSIRDNDIKNAATLGLIEETPIGWATAIRINIGPDNLKGRLNRDIEITGNRISNCGQAPIRAWACQGFKAAGNTVHSANIMNFPSERVGIDLINVGDATISGNIVESENTDSVLRVSKNCDKAKESGNSLQKPLLQR